VWWHTLLGVVAGLVLVYLVLLGLLWRCARRHPDTVNRRDALRLLPDVLRLIRRLAADKTVTTGVRVRLVLLLVYLASPIDLVPDFIPVVGYADDAIVVALVLRSVTRRAGPDAIERHCRARRKGWRSFSGLSAGGRPLSEVGGRPAAAPGAVSRLKDGTERPTPTPAAGTPTSEDRLTSERSAPGRSVNIC
jgi:uncharacterized membrane protein YkvA (DUF1232 family)